MCIIYPNFNTLHDIYIEEQLNTRYRGLDIAKEGQLEARERLLTEMEEKAKEKVEEAERETFRLKVSITLFTVMSLYLLTYWCIVREKIIHYMIL